MVIGIHDEGGNRRLGHCDGESWLLAQQDEVGGEAECCKTAAGRSRNLSLC